MTEEKSETSQVKNSLVIGTSNSIVRGGWYDGYVSAYPGKVIRCAVGGAPFSQFLGKLSELTEEKFDHIIIDTSPNDESFSSQVGTHWVFEKLYSDFISVLTSRSKTVVMRIPAEAFLGVETAAAKIQKTVCEQLGATYIDLSTTLQEMSGPDGIYRDKYHPKTDLMFKAGVMLAKQIISIKEENKYPQKISAFQYFEEYGVSGTLSAEAVHTSLISETFSVIPQDGKLKFSQFRLCFGFFVNTQNCNALLRLHGVDEVRDIACYFEPRARPEITFVPIRNGFVMDGISVVRPWRVNEYALHSRIEKGPYLATVGAFVCHTAI